MMLRAQKWSGLMARSYFFVSLGRGRMAYQTPKMHPEPVCEGRRGPCSPVEETQSGFGQICYHYWSCQLRFNTELEMDVPGPASTPPSHSSKGTQLPAHLCSFNPIDPTEHGWGGQQGCLWTALAHPEGKIPPCTKSPGRWTFPDFCPSSPAVPSYNLFNCLIPSLVYTKQGRTFVILEEFKQIFLFSRCATFSL